MADKFEKVIIKHLTATSEEWAAKDIILHKGEIGYDSTTETLKVGDGLNKWSKLKPINIDLIRRDKIDNIEEAAQVNIIEKVKVDGAELEPDSSKAVNVDMSGKVDKTTKVAGINLYDDILVNELRTALEVDNTNNTSDIDKPVSTSQKTYIDNQDATTLASAKSYADNKKTEAINESNSYTDNKIADIVNSAPETLDTLHELANALGNDENFSTTVANQIGTKVSKLTTIANLPLDNNITVDELKEELAIDKVQNTTDAEKEVSIPQAAAISLAISNLDTKVNNDIDKAIDNIKDNVPVEYDTLNKLNNRISTIIASSGDDITEVVDARTDTDGTVHAALGDRLNADFNKLVEGVKESTFESTILNIPNTGEGFLNDFNEKGKSVQDILETPNLHDVTRSTYTANCTRVSIDNGWRVTATDNTKSGYGFYAGWFFTDAETEIVNLIYLPAGQHTVSADFKLLAVNTAGVNKIKIGLRSATENLITLSTEHTLTLDTVVRKSQAFNVPAAGYYSPYFAVNGNTVEITNVQVNAGTNTTWYAYNTPAALPHAPSPINSVPYEHNVISCGKNLFNIDTSPSNVWNLTYVVSENKITLTTNTTGLSRYCVPVYLPKKVPYTLSCKVRVVSGTSPNEVGAVHIRESHTGGSNYGSADFSTNTNDIQSIKIKLTETIRPDTVSLWLYPVKNQATVNDFVTEYYDIQIEEGDIDTPQWEPYQGKTYPYRLEAVDVAEYANFASLPATGVYDTQYKTLDDGKLWEWAGGGYVEFALRSLPQNNVQDIYDNDTIIKNTTVRMFTSDAGWYYQGDEAGGTITKIVRYDTRLKWTTDLDTTNANMRCNIHKANISVAIGNTMFYKMADQTILYLRVPALSNKTDTGAREWIANQIATQGAIIFELPLPAPVTYQIKKYGETYDGQVWEYNAPIPTQSGYTTIYTDAAVQPTLIAKEYLISQLGDIRVLKSADDKSFNPLTTTDAVYNRLTHKTLEEENAERDADSQDLKQKVPDAPDSDGTYTLKCTVTSGVKTYQWIEDDAQ